jgi:hypothetical protein
VPIENAPIFFCLRVALGSSPRIKRPVALEFPRDERAPILGGFLLERAKHEL